ncbi:MAG: hypothetical protein ACP6IY_20540 [Promethearchaeia archaeon]
MIWITNLATDYPTINNIIIGIIIVALAIGISYAFKLISFKVILLMISLVIILLYAFDILGQIWAAGGFIIFIMVLYGIFNSNRRVSYEG